MFVEIVDALRCLRPHESTWLVLAAGRMDGRHVMDGTLGCHLCGTRYPIVDGVADFRDADADRAAPPVLQSPAPATAAVDPDDVLRAAALLNHAEGAGFTVLAGPWVHVAPMLARLAPVPVVVVDPPPGLAMGHGVSGVRVAERLPFADGAARGVALGAHAPAAMLLDAVRVLRTGGRLVAPAGMPVPPGITELARDAESWVGERQAAPSRPVTLTRAR